MPELPEVEITRRGVENHFLDSVLLDCEVRQPNLRWPVPAEIHACVGHRLESVGRRAKYLLMDFGQQILVVHLGMSGALKIVEATSAWDKHDHIQWVFPHAALRYNDPRRFGSVEWACRLSTDKTLQQWQCRYNRFARLGPEPFSAEFTPQQLFKATRAKQVNVKSLLLSGLAVVGVGNIYACEALFRSGISPSLAAGRLTRAQAVRLHTEILAVLTQAIENGGSSLKNFHAIDGELGNFQLQCDVYGREGLPCRICKQPVLRKTMAQRSTFYCARCQR